MPFARDEKIAAEFDGIFGEYLTTYLSEPTGQIRADIFRNGKRVEAHVQHPYGVRASDATELYAGALMEYARKEGVADRFQLILS